VLAETSRVAAFLHVKVEGVVTDQKYIVDCSSPQYPGEKCMAAGWYVGGKAYYWRKHLLTQDFAYGTAIAVHEVCHAKSYHHDKAHEACINLFN
jgi:hypothetical protein